MTATIDFDALMDEVNQTVIRRGELLTRQEDVVARLQQELYRAEAALAEVQYEYTEAVTEADDLAAYTGYVWDDSTYEVRTYGEYGD